MNHAKLLLDACWYFQVIGPRWDGVGETFQHLPDKTKEEMKCITGDSISKIRFDLIEPLILGAPHNHENWKKRVAGREERKNK